MVAASTGVHWLTFATAKPVDEVCQVLGGGFGQVERQGAFFQPKSRCHESGARVYFGSERSTQPVVVNMPGEVCEGWSTEGVRWAGALGWVTRLDLACDVHPAEQARRRMLEMRRAWKVGKVDTNIRTFSEARSDLPEGWTWYFGGKQSQLRLRAYDRRGPLRLEFQWRPSSEVGRVVPEYLERKGAAAVWRSMAESIKFPMPWYQELLAGEVAVLPKMHETDSALMQVLEHLQVQLGTTLWALELLGIDVRTLAVEPEAPMRGDLAAKQLRWAADADVQGYDGDKLRAEVLCKLKSQRVCG